jgi:tetratricopeptide (TPR) repeat protein
MRIAPRLHLAVLLISTAALGQTPDEDYARRREAGDRLLEKARAALRTGDDAGAKSSMSAAAVEFRAADQARPGRVEVLLPLARSLAGSAQWAPAEEAYNNVLLRDPGNVPAHVELYQVFEAQGRTADSEALLKRAIAENPKQYQFRSLLVVHHYRHNQSAAARAAVIELRATWPDNPNAYLMAGDTWFRLGAAADALEQYRAGSEADEKQKVVYQKRMIEVLLRQNKRQEAGTIANSILRADPKDLDARSVVAGLLVDQGGAAKALPELESLVAAAPDNAAVHYNLGRAYAASNNLVKAREQFRESTRLQPEYGLAWLALAQIELSSQQFESALECTRAVLRMDANNVDARLMQAAALAGQKKNAEARRIIESIVAANPKSGEAQYQLGVLNLSEKKFDEAAMAFQRAYEINPGNARALLGVAETHAAEGKIQAGLDILQRELVREPNRGDLRVAYANLAVRAGQFDLAINQFQATLARIDPRSPAAADLHLRIGEAYRRKGDLNRSILALQKVRELAPNDPVVHTTLAMTLDAAGRKEEARGSYMAALKQDPNNGVTLNNLAFLLADNGGDLDIALGYAQRAVKAMPDSPEVLDTLGWVYFKKGMAADAVTTFREVVRRAPDAAANRYHLALALAETGDRTGATAECRAALKANPSADIKADAEALLKKLGR